MARVKLGEVAREYKATIKKSDGLPVVGLEHLTPGEITLSHWDVDTENTFTKGFKKGHMLFGRRRAYLKKAALAPFDGICSGDITVIEAIPEKINPELLPFIIQNDMLFDYAVGNSAGSLSPRVKWESLKDYEFELPELDKQEALVEILKAAHRARSAYQQQILATDELVKSQFIEMFGDVYKEETSWQKFDFTDVIEDCSRHGTKIPTDDYLPTGAYPIIDQGQDFISGYRNDRTGLFENTPAIIFGDHTRYFKLVDFPFFMGADGVKILKSRIPNINYRFLLEQLKMAPIPNMGYNRHFRWLKEFSIYVPPLSMQEQFAAFVEQSDKSKFVVSNRNLSRCF